MMKGFCKGEMAERGKEWAERKKGDFLCSLPGSSTQGSDPSLENASKKGERVFPGDYKVNQGEKDAPMDDEAHDHRDHVHPQLPSNHFQVLDGNDLPTD